LLNSPLTLEVQKHNTPYSSSEHNEIDIDRDLVPKEWTSTRARYLDNAIFCHFWSRLAVKWLSLVLKKLATLYAVGAGWRCTQTLSGVGDFCGSYWPNEIREIMTLILQNCRLSVSVTC